MSDRNDERSAEDVAGPIKVVPTDRSRRPTPTVERIAPPRRPTWSDTGRFEFDDLTDQSGIVNVPSGEIEIEPLISKRRVRPRTQTEQLLRLAFSSLLMLSLLLLFGSAIAGGVVRALTGARADGWREVPVTINSTPSGAQVYVADKLRGRTPFSTAERCRGRTISIRVELEGHDIWQWSGICPVDQLKLNATLQQTSQ